MTAQEINTVAPDGKWGWMIVMAYALNGITTLSLSQGFVLMFKDTFRQLGFSATTGSIIINANVASGMILGLGNGPLLRIFGYRKMAVIGSILYTVGVTMTAFSNSFILLLIFFGLCASEGICVTLSAFSYALNSYFTTKRSRAMSLAMTIIGLGPIVVPQVTIFLTSYYGFQATILLYGAFSLHSLVASLLLQPVKWHTKRVKNQSKSVDKEPLTKEEKNKSIDEKNSFQDDENWKNSQLDLDNMPNKRRITVSSINHDAEIGSIYGTDIPFARQMSESYSVISTDLSASRENDLDGYKIAENGHIKKRTKIFKSNDVINLSSSINIFEEKLEPLSRYNSYNVFNGNGHDFQSTIESDSLLQKGKSKTELHTGTNDVEKSHAPPGVISDHLTLSVYNYLLSHYIVGYVRSEKKSVATQILKNIVQSFDLDLLRDPVYVNIMFGMAIAIFSEINFSQLTPFILSDMKLSTKQIATVMSVIASVDLVFRCLAPFIGEWLHQPPRIMYMLSLCLLIISRSSLLFVNGLISMMIVAAGLGIAKGIRSVYMPLVIPHYVPLSRLPNASGIQMIVNGVMLLFAGPILGVIRDAVGSYTPCIIIVNFVTALTVIFWSIEMYIVRRKKLQADRQQQENS